MALRIKQGLAKLRALVSLPLDNKYVINHDDFWSLQCLPLHPGELTLRTKPLSTSSRSSFICWIPDRVKEWLLREMRRWLASRKWPPFGGWRRRPPTCTRRRPYVDFVTSVPDKKPSAADCRLRSGTWTPSSRPIEPTGSRTSWGFQYWACWPNWRARSRVAWGEREVPCTCTLRTSSAAMASSEPKCLWELALLWLTNTRGTGAFVSLSMETEPLNKDKFSRPTTWPNFGTCQVSFQGEKYTAHLSVSFQLFLFAKTMGTEWVHRKLVRLPVRRSTPKEITSRVSWYCFDPSFDPLSSWLLTGRRNGRPCRKRSRQVCHRLLFQRKGAVGLRVCDVPVPRPLYVRSRNVLQNQRRDPRGETNQGSHFQLQREAPFIGINGRRGAEKNRVGSQENGRRRGQDCQDRRRNRRLGIVQRRLREKPGGKDPRISSLGKTRTQEYSSRLQFVNGYELTKKNNVLFF